MEVSLSSLSLSLPKSVSPLILSRPKPLCCCTLGGPSFPQKGIILSIPLRSLPSTTTSPPLHSNPLLNNFASLSLSTTAISAGGGGGDALPGGGRGGGGESGGGGGGESQTKSISLEEALKSQSSDVIVLYVGVILILILIHPSPPTLINYIFFFCQLTHLVGLIITSVSLFPLPHWYYHYGQIFHSILTSTYGFNSEY